MLCSLLLTVGTVMAAEPGYERFSHPTLVTPIIDGQWTSPDEWTDGEETWIGTNVVFRSTWDGDMTRWIVEFLSDTTDDSGDYLQFCIDAHQTGGSIPTLGAGHFMLKINGHTEMTLYMGDGTGWSEAVNPFQIEWDNSLSSSPTDSTPHWIYEIQMDKDSATISWKDEWNLFLRVYDASNPGITNRPSWPPTDPDIPDEYGVENYSLEPIPEGLTFGVMAILSSISVIVGYKYFVKRKETKAQ